jgi:hypothetical protein
MASDSICRPLPFSSQNLRTTQKRGAMSSTPIKPRAPKPESLVLIERDNYFSVKWRWFQPQHIFFAFFAFMWFSFLIGWYVSLSSFNLLEQG